MQYKKWESLVDKEQEKQKDEICCFCGHVGPRAWEYPLTPNEHAGFCSNCGGL